jgi:bla regulator protein BlaR1
MMAAWMVYCATLGVLISGAALLVERIVDRSGGATRRVWAWALAATLALPLAGIGLRSAAPANEEGIRSASGPMGEAVLRSVAFMSSMDAPLAVAWLAASLVAATLLLGATARSRRRRRGWRVAVVDGVRVLVSRQVGPAVVGIARPMIVLPVWALEASAAERTMMLRHEQEHLWAGDPRLALFGLTLVAAMPWSPALWYMAYRLRLAIEVDCDRRVVRGGEVDVHAYGSLLLAVGRRRSALPLAAAAFSRPRSALEHRIDRMTHVPGRASRWRSTLLGVSAAVIVAVAWGVPQPGRAASVSATVTPCPNARPAPPLLRWS